MKSRLFTMILFLFVTAGQALAQDTKNEVGLLLGALSTGSRTIQLPTVSKADISTGITYQISYGRRFVISRCNGDAGE